MWYAWGPRGRRHLRNPGGVTMTPSHSCSERRFHSAASIANGSCIVLGRPGNRAWLLVAGDDYLGSRRLRHHPVDPNSNYWPVDRGLMDVPASSLRPPHVGTSYLLRLTSRRAGR